MPSMRMPGWSDVPPQDLIWESEFGESSDEDENNIADIDTVSDNLAVKSTTVYHVREQKAVQEVETDDEPDSLASGAQVVGDDDSDLSENEDENGNEFETASECSSDDTDQEESDTEDSRLNTDEQFDADFEDFLPEATEEDMTEMSEKFQQFFILRCFALVLLHLNSEHGIMFYLALLFTIPGIFKMLSHPTSTLKGLYNCLSAKTAPLTFLCMSLLLIHNHAATSKLSLHCVILLRMHGVVRRQEVFPTLFRLHGCRASIWSNIWCGIGNFAMAIYALSFSLCLSYDDFGGKDLALYLDVISYIIHYGGVISLHLGIMLDGSHIYSRIEPTALQSFRSRVEFCMDYSNYKVGKVYESIEDNARVFYMACL